jgi:HSP20 family molecular chaperone IbpA
MTQLRTIDAQALAHMNKLLVGFDRVFNDRFFQGTQSSNYPPHNVVKYSEDTYAIEVAVAGFSKD